MCTATPDVPPPAERQAVKLPDQGATATRGDSSRRRAMLAGLVTSMTGALGSPTTTRPTLG
jgi:hypothetical protein